MASLDMALDDVIKKNRRNNEKRDLGQGRPPRGRGPGVSSRDRRPFGRYGAPQRNPLGVNSRSSSFTIAKSVRRPRPLPWQRGLFEDSLKAVGFPGINAGTKLYISNLDFGVSNQDIRELFSGIGELVQYAIHFDKDARPSGTAEVLFARTSDALQAFKRYNNVQLDGRPMKIEIIGANSAIPISRRVNVGGANGKKRTVVMAHRTQGGPSNVRGGGSRGRGGGSRGHGGGRRGALWKKRNVEKSADELDEELLRYHAQAIQS